MQETFPFERVADAHRLLDGGHLQGKLVRLSGPLLGPSPLRGSSWAWYRNAWRFIRYTFTAHAAPHTARTLQTLLG